MDGLSSDMSDSFSGCTGKTGVDICIHFSPVSEFLVLLTDVSRKELHLRRWLIDKVYIP